MTPGAEAGLGLYIHIPFCHAKCAYCDFNSYSGLEGLIPQYIEALEAEAQFWAVSRGRLSLATVYFGGGTPSLLRGDQLARIIEACRNSFDLAPGAEITLEANPDSISEALLTGLRLVGINRLSLGVQSFEPGWLRLLGRLHSAEQAKEAFRIARRAGFSNINLDLMYGLPGQSLEAWSQDLKQALELAPEHLSLYPLTLEEDTPLGKAVALGQVSLPDSDLVADQYLRAKELLAEAGYEHYEISNWARPGRGCRHNQLYWKNLPYLGLGAGAHSSLEGYRFHNVTTPEQYIQAWKVNSPLIQNRGSFPASIEGLEAISRELEMAETMILGLRLVAGVGLEDFWQRFGIDATSLYKEEIEELIGLGLLEAEGSRLRLTQRGRLLGNEVFLRFLPQSG